MGFEPPPGTFIPMRAQAGVPRTVVKGNQLGSSEAKRCSAKGPFPYALVANMMHSNYEGSMQGKFGRDHNDHHRNGLVSSICNSLILLDQLEHEMLDRISTCRPVQKYWLNRYDLGHWRYMTLQCENMFITKNMPHTES